MTSFGDTLTKQLLEGRSFPAVVVQILNSQRRVVINRGSVDGVRLGQRFLVYGVGPDIIDPETQKSLGRLEVLRGTGEVIHVQEKMATIESTRKRAIEKRTRTEMTLNRLYAPTQETVTSEPEMLEFEYPEEGDFAKPI
jgi:hypothetical protein